MVTATSRVVPVVDGVGLRVLEWGQRNDQGSTLLVHGLASNARLWDGVARRLAAAGRHVLAVDLRGHGESTPSPAGYGFDVMADDLAAVVRAIGEVPVSVAGQSWGGNVVIHFAARHPSLVARVVAVDGGFIRLAEDFPDWEQASRVLAPPRFDGLHIDDLRRHAAERYVDWPREGVEGQLANFRVLGDGTVEARLRRDDHMTILRSLWEDDPRIPAASLTAPLMVISAGPVDDAKRERIRELLRAAPTGQVVELHAHHDVHAQLPDEVVAAMVEFGA